MTKRMLIDATHAEETRVVVLDGNRLEDFDVETSTKRQLKGNIYLAKVVRVEPSLQAAFVEYGGNRHGFLAFSEIHPDYYQIPVADRQRLLEMQAEEARREDEEDDLELALSHTSDDDGADDEAADHTDMEQEQGIHGYGSEAWAQPRTPHMAPAPQGAAEHGALETVGSETGGSAQFPVEAETWASPVTPRLIAKAQRAQALAVTAEVLTDDDADESGDSGVDSIELLPPPETIGGDERENGEDHRERRIPPRFLRNYKIQEVVRRRQIMLVQVVKEERGTKGAALTTYLSLAGRFGVLMPNSPRGGGISRKITSAADRRRLREVIAELEIPRGMGLIIRTAGANRPKPEIKRDCEYLLRLWDDIREHTLKSVAPALIYEEASLIKRAIRDVYSRDIDEILVDGEEGWRAAHDFMRMLMPTHAKKVQLWRDAPGGAGGGSAGGSVGGQPLFARNQVEAQLDAMLMPIVQLRSGGYLVINQAEALVAIDVNSGRSTRERNIEETALRTNLEAADEVARQLRLRDLAGLIVIDFIDMESKRHNAMVERRLKEALKNDRARIQVGHISHFGLLEMSRQRLRPSLAETSFIACPHCGGTGHVRSTESSAIHVLRGIEDEGAKRRSAEVVVHVSTPVALYLLNHKRERLREIELRYVMRVIVAADDSQIAPQYRIEKVRTRSPDDVLPVVTQDRPIATTTPFESEFEDDEDIDALGADDDDDDADDDMLEEGREADAAGPNGDDTERRRKRRRRRRRGRRDETPVGEQSIADPAMGEQTTDAAQLNDSHAADPLIVIPPAADVPRGVEAADEEEPESATETPAEAEAEDSFAHDADAAGSDEKPDPFAANDEESRARRRGRRGGRRRRRENEGELSPLAVPGAEQPDLRPVYAGPTPADPFGGQVFDIFDVMERAEREAEAQPQRRGASALEIINRAAPEVISPTPLEIAAHAASVEAAVTEPEAEIVNTPAPEPVAEALPRVEATPATDEVTLSAFAGGVPDAPLGASEVGDGRSEAPVTASPEPEPTESVSAEPPPAEPAIKPIVIGAGGDAPAEKKRGWWRR